MFLICVSQSINLLTKLRRGGLTTESAVGNRRLGFSSTGETGDGGGHRPYVALSEVVPVPPRDRQDELRDLVDLHLF